MPTRLCGVAGCPNPVVTRGRCRTHATQARKANRSEFDAFYGSKAWKIARRHQLVTQPFCEFVLEDGTECGRLADSVHHIVELTEGGPQRDPANLMSTCRPHHAAIHATRQRVASAGTVAN